MTRTEDNNLITEAHQIRLLAVAHNNNNRNKPNFISKPSPLERFVHFYIYSPVHSLQIFVNFDTESEK